MRTGFLWVALLLFSLGGGLAGAQPSVSERLRSARDTRTRECSPAFTALMRAKVSRESCTAAFACEHFLQSIFGEFPTYCVLMGGNFDQANVRIETCRQKSFYEEGCDFDTRDRAAFRSLSEKFRSRIVNKLGQKSAGASACDSLEKDLSEGKISGACKEEAESLMQARKTTAASAAQLAEMLENLAGK